MTRSCPSRVHYRCSRGVTILELLIAVTMSGLVLSSVFFAWRHLASHTAKGRRSAVFQVEADGLARSILAQIRRSPRIVSVRGNGIAFVSASGADTVNYELEGERLMRNGEEVRLVSGSVRFDEFSLEGRGNSLVETGETLLTMRISLRDEFGNATALSLDASVRLPDKNDAMDDFGQW